MASAAANAQATDASTAFSEVQSAGADMAGYAWPVVASITAALIGIKLFKKFANRAS
ncbi:phage coat protein [Vreelandella venusta]|uniref:Phage coat protein n=2 Tax=Vreelandella venusta TaxID=44935 RepID=A0ABX2B554_9GAMM|nr:phage coat protein [Halomonas venusta]NPT29232.1 phage coat protein [Halomonas venusta]